MFVKRERVVYRHLLRDCVVVGEVVYPLSDVTRFGRPPLSHDKARFHFYAHVAALSDPTYEVPANGAQAELSEFWSETLAVVAGVWLRMAKAVFPYLERIGAKT